MKNLVDSIIGTAGSDRRLVRVRGEERRLELASSELAWTASGTATLECALLDVPMIVGYRLRALTYAIARLLAAGYAIVIFAGFLLLCLPWATTRIRPNKTGSKKRLPLENRRKTFHFTAVTADQHLRGWERRPVGGPTHHNL